jgi:hypothetical protein
MLPFGFLSVPLVGLVEQDIPLALVIVVFEVNDLLAL